VRRLIAHEHAPFADERRGAGIGVPAGDGLDVGVAELTLRRVARFRQSVGLQEQALAGCERAADDLPIENA